MGLTHLDAGILIGFLDRADAHHAAASLVLAEALDRGDHLAMASSAFAEILVAPARAGERAIEVVQDARRRLPIDIVGIDADVALEAARLRAAHRSLRLPDALVIAAAVEAGAQRLVTTDRRWPERTALGVDLVIDVR